jgi:hypothetical protein
MEGAVQPLLGGQPVMVPAVAEQRQMAHVGR